MLHYSDAFPKSVHFSGLLIRIFCKMNRVTISFVLGIDCESKIPFQELFLNE